MRNNIAHLSCENNKLRNTFWSTKETLNGAKIEKRLAADGTTEAYYFRRR